MTGQVVERSTDDGLPGSKTNLFKDMAYPCAEGPAAPKAPMASAGAEGPNQDTGAEGPNRDTGVEP